MKVIKFFMASMLLTSVIILSACSKEGNNDSQIETTEQITTQITTVENTTEFYSEPTTEEATFAALEYHNYHIGEDENGMPIIIDDVG